MSSSNEYFDPTPVYTYPDGSAVHRVRDPNGCTSFGFVTLEPGGYGGRAREVTVRIPTDYIARMVETMSQTGLIDRDPDRDELGLAVAAAAVQCIPEMTRTLVSTVLGMVAEKLGRTDEESVHGSIVAFLRQWAVDRCRSNGRTFPTQAWTEEDMDSQLLARIRVHESGSPAHAKEVRDWLAGWLDSH